MSERRKSCILTNIKKSESVTLWPSVFIPFPLAKAWTMLAKQRQVTVTIRVYQITRKQITNISNGLSFLPQFSINKAFLLTKNENSFKFTRTYPMKQMRRRNLKKSQKSFNTSFSFSLFNILGMELRRINAQIIIAVTRTVNRATQKCFKELLK